MHYRIICISSVVTKSAISYVFGHKKSLMENFIFCAVMVLHSFYGKEVYVMRCAIWYHLYKLKNVKHPWRSVTFSKVAGFQLVNFKLYKWYQIVQNITLLCKNCLPVLWTCQIENTPLLQSNKIDQSMRTSLSIVKASVPVIHSKYQSLGH